MATKDDAKFALARFKLYYEDNPRLLDASLDNVDGEYFIVAWHYPPMMLPESMNNVLVKSMPLEFQFDGEDLHGWFDYHKHNWKVTDSDERFPYELDDPCYTDQERELWRKAAELVQQAIRLRIANM